VWVADIKIILITQNYSLYQDEPVCWHPPLQPFHSVMLRWGLLSYPVNHHQSNCLKWTLGFNYVFVHQYIRRQCYLVFFTFNCSLLNTTITFSHLSEAFIQSNLHCIQDTHFSNSCISWESNPWLWCCLHYAIQPQEGMTISM